jgi:MFS transporter, FHS family, glucose/mannose:H+ symporter
MQLSTVETLAGHEYFGAKAIAHAVFVPTGMVTVMLGPLLPLLAAKWSLNDSQAGYLITAQFIGALLGTVSTSLLLPGLGFRWSIAAGQLLMALGVATIISSGFGWAATAVFCYGMGIGLTIPAGNLMVAEASRERRASTLNLLNFSWSAGAVSCPFLLAALQRAYGTQFFLHALAGLLVLLTLILFSCSSKVLPPRQIPSSPGTELPWFRCFQNRTAVMLGALFFVYVGTESALGTWLASYARRVGDAPIAAWMTVPSYFYGALLLGRALAPLTLLHLSDAKQSCFGALLALLSSGALLSSRSVPAIAIWASLAGLGLSTLYPITIGFLSSSFGADASRIGGLMFALSTLGGASVPWLVGFASTEFRSLRTALVIPLAGCLVMLLLFSRPRWRQLVA